MDKLAQLLNDLESAKAELQKADEALDAFVRPIILQYLDVGNYEEARRLVSKCGNSTTRTSLFDTICQHKISNVGR